MTESKELKAKFDRFTAPLRQATKGQLAKWFVLSAACCGVTIAGLWYLGDRFEVGLDRQKSHCVEGDVFLIDKYDKTPVKDALFAYRAGKKLAKAFPENRMMGKYVRAVEGDTVSINDEEEIFVNGRFVAQGLYWLHDKETHTVDPKLLKKFTGKKTLKKGEYWMMGTSLKSFDSRYWGVINQDQIIGRMYVLHRPAR